MKKKPTIDKKKIAIGLLVTTMIVVPAGIGYKYVEPLIFRPAKTLFSKLPITYANLSPIRIRYRAIKSIPVRVIPKGRGSGQHIRVTYKDNSPIKIIRKNSGEEALEEIPGLPQVQVRRTFTRGYQPRRTEE